MLNNWIKTFLLRCSATLCLISCSTKERPVDFVAIQAVDSTIITDARYATGNNFTGQPVPGYQSKCILLTTDAAKALSRVQQALLKSGYSLLVYDGYRPQRAVDAFVKWTKDPNDTVMKSIYYPTIPKDSLLAKGYIAAKSGHSRGGTVDVTLVKQVGERWRMLDMGTPFDFFGKESGVGAEQLTPSQLKHRELLHSFMKWGGFVRLPEEWWHFTYSAETYPDTMFNFPVKGAC